MQVHGIHLKSGQRLGLEEATMKTCWPPWLKKKSIYSARSLSLNIVEAFVSSGKDFGPGSVRPSADGKVAYSKPASSLSMTAAGSCPNRWKFSKVLQASLPPMPLRYWNYRIPSTSKRIGNMFWQTISLGRGAGQSSGSGACACSCLPSNRVSR